MFFSAQDKGEMAAMVHNWPQDDVQAIVVTGEHTHNTAQSFKCRQGYLPTHKPNLDCALGAASHSVQGLLWQLPLAVTLAVTSHA